MKLGLFTPISSHPKAPNYNVDMYTNIVGHSDYPDRNAHLGLMGLLSQGFGGLSLRIKK